MNTLIDHLSAVLVAAILLGALLALHLRDSQQAVDEVANYTAQRQAASLLNVVGRDLDNVLGRDQAQTFLGGYEARLERTAAGGDTLTTALSLPSLVPPAAGRAEAPAQIRYRLEGTGRTATTSGGDVPLFRLVRAVQFGADTTETVVSGDVVDFDVRACTPDGCRAEGPPPEGTTHLEVRLAVATGLGPRGRGVFVARQGASYRPQNLPANRTASDGPPVLIEL